MGGIDFGSAYLAMTALLEIMRYMTSHEQGRHRAKKITGQSRIWHRRALGAERFTTNAYWLMAELARLHIRNVDEPASFPTRNDPLAYNFGLLQIGKQALVPMPYVYCTPLPTSRKTQLTSLLVQRKTRWTGNSQSDAASRKIIPEPSAHIGCFRLTGFSATQGRTLL